MRVDGMSLIGLAAACLCGACESKPRTGAQSSEPGPTPTAARTEQEPEQPLVKAYPPGVTPPPEAPKPAGVDTKTGVCAFRETGFDGQDTRFAENLVVKIKSGRIVSATYSYKGSYATEGDDDNLNVPIEEKKWVEFSMALSNGKQTFKIRVDADRFKMKGTAVQDAESGCTWLSESELAAAASASAEPAASAPSKSGASGKSGRTR
jgi:hypothetical protein